MSRYQIIIETDAEDIEAIIKDKFKFSFNFRIVDIENVKTTRSLQQNRALYKFFSLLSEALNEKSFDMRMIIRNEIAIEWTPDSVKQYLWKPLQKALLGSDSTTKLKTTDIDIVFDNLNRVIVERTKGEVHIPFPSWESLREIE